MANSVNKKVIEGHSHDLQEALVYKDKYENLMDDITDFNLEHKFEDIDSKHLEGFEGTDEEKLA